MKLLSNKVCPGCYDTQDHAYRILFEKHYSLNGSTGRWSHYYVWAAYSVSETDEHGDRVMVARQKTLGHLKLALGNYLTDKANGTLKDGQAYGAPKYPARP